MVSELDAYIKSLVSITFQFTPNVEVKSVNEYTYQVTMRGTEEETRLLMGKDGNTFHSIKHLLRCFGRRHNIFIYPYVQSGAL